MKAQKIMLIIIVLCCVVVILPTLARGEISPTHTDQPPPNGEPDTNVVASTEHEHEMGKVFSFQFQGSTAMNYIRPFCKTCNNVFGYTAFRGTPTDSSYLDAIKRCTGVSEISAGEYYTITAIVTLGDYDFNRTRIRCEVRSDNIIVNFSVDFDEAFEESVGLLNEGDTITFSGKLYDEGFGFTDSVLVIE